MKWGILATGTIADKFAATIARMADSQEVVAVASRNSEKACDFAAKYHISRSYGTYSDLLTDSEVEIVYIATPNNLHYENAYECLMHGKHVLCEKPFTTNASDAQKLYDLAKTKGLFIMEAMWTRFLPLSEKINNIIANGQLGEIQYIRVDYGFVAKGARKERKFDSALAGGALLDIGVYNLHFLNSIMKTTPQILASEVHLNEYGTDDFSTILLRYPNGCRATSTAAIGSDIPREALIVGSNGQIHLPDFQRAERLIWASEDQEPQEIYEPFEINGFEYEIKEATRCVQAGMTSSDIFKPSDSIAIIQLLDKLRNDWNMKFSFEL